MKIILSTIAVVLLASHCHTIDSRDLYDTVVQGSVTFPRGNDESILVNLHSPIHFYTEKYDSIYVSFLSSNVPSHLVPSLKSEVMINTRYHPSSKCRALYHKRNLGIFRHGEGGEVDGQGRADGG